MRLIFLIILTLLPTNVLANDYIGLRESYIDYKKFRTGSRNPLIDNSGLIDSEIDQELSIYFNIDILKHFYWDNQIMSYTDRDKESNKTIQFRLVGWNFKLGWKIWDFLHIEYEHLSQHLLDYRNPNNKFPVEDSFGIKLFLYQNDKSD